MDRLYVNIYEAGRAYGGPEEGGWYYDTGHLIGAIPIELSPDELATTWEFFSIDAGIDDEAGTDNEGEWDRDLWGKILEDALQAKARKIREIFVKQYPYTRARFSSVGGVDHDVVIEDHFGESYPATRPHYE